MFRTRYPLLRWGAVVFISALLGCRHESPSPVTVSGQFSIRDFHPLANWGTDSLGGKSSPGQTDKLIYLDYIDADQTGFLLPSPRQTNDGYFHLEFFIQNTGTTSCKFAYQIYYQNESYKFPERDGTDSTRMNPYAAENFYGSWEEAGKGFILTGEIPPDGKFYRITNQFRIVGNPRNEKRYFSGDINNRWKRNPRVGEYSFLLVVTLPENPEHNLIPDYIQDIHLLRDSVFINPYFYYLYGEGRKLSNTIVSSAAYRLKVIAKPDPGAGIYINPNFFPRDQYGKFFRNTCGNDPGLAHTAPFEQFIHFIDPTTKFGNIPVIADVLKDNYSQRDYNWNKRFYRKEELVAITASTTKRPCETVLSDPLAHKITLKNPGVKFGEWEKQNVGVITRHGLTYGKWTVKAKLTELLNKNNMWNGLTNAVWLITQSQEEWNSRRDCRNGGYMSSYFGGQQDKRVKNVSYSEIDFEILKTVPYCPGYVLPPAYNQGLINQFNVADWDVPLPEELIAENDRIQVACTNWDMACWEPAGFRDGCSPVEADGQVFWAHRWDRNYRAITEKTPAGDDELFGGDYFYFQIDWQPDRIIWRIGPERNRLRMVGYVDYTVTSIPNNQMLLIISQEFHNTRWWVGSMYAQDNIPFPRNDIVGEIYEVTIE